MKTSDRMMLLGVVLLVGAAALGLAQDAKVDRAVVPLTTPGKPALIKAGVLMGGITVKGYEGKEVIVEARVREEKLDEGDEEDAAELAGDEADKAEPDKSAGMKLIPVVGTGLEIEEQDNVVTIGSESWKNAVDLVIQVPSASNLELSSTNDGDIVVENVSGAIEVSNVNGSNTLRNVSGNVVAHTVNGEILVTMSRVTPDKPMSFSTMNGDIDVTFPADIKAAVRMKSQQGDIYSDFDVTLKPAPQKPAEQAEKSGKGKYRISFDRFLTGAVNGGGPEFTFNTFNGDIYIRKGK
ncbi:MAG TPA: DUF4097 family beta strand repeat-containing protein [Acidobacteriota bacterium]|nr:DUF4097 family beta strand repeat-containing protein [Acidobacteriota bacterium]